MDAATDLDAATELDAASDFGPDDSAILSDDAVADLYEHAPCGLLSLSVGGVVLRVNETFTRWTGWSPADMVGVSFDALLGVGSQLFYETRCLPVLRMDGELREVALELRCRDGRQLSVMVNVAVRPEVDGVARVVRLAVFDVTARQDARRDLLSAGRAAERSERRVRVLRQASTTFTGAQSVACLTALLTQTARTALDATSSAVLLVAPGGTELVVAAGTHPVGPTVSLTAAGPEAVALRRGAVVALGDLDEVDRSYPGLGEVLFRSRFAAMAVLPLRQQDVSLGVLVCFFGRIRSFEDDDLQLGRDLAEQAALALQHLHVEDQLHFQALHDELTGLANRELLRRELAPALAASTADGRPMALIFVDLDGFKQINDQHGHLVGDAVLVATAARLRDAVRTGDLVARIGGDEFVVLCSTLDADVALDVAERIRRSVRRPIAGAEAEHRVTGSIGVAIAGAGTDPDPDALIAAADAAMYRSKAQGRDRATLVDLRDQHLRDQHLRD